MFNDVPANPMVAAQEYFDEQDAKNEWQPESMLSKAKTAVKEAMSSALEEGETIVEKLVGSPPHSRKHSHHEQHLHGTHRSEEVLPDEKVIREEIKRHEIPTREEEQKAEEDFFGTSKS